MSKKASTPPPPNNQRPPAPGPTAASSKERSRHRKGNRRMTIPKSFLWLLAAAGALVAPYLFWLHILFLHNLWVGLFGPDIDGGGWFAAFFFATSSIALCAASIATAISTSPGGGPRP